MSQYIKELHVKRLHDDAELPVRAHDDDAGADLKAYESVTLEPMERCLVGTGVAVAIPYGHVGFVLPRSGMASKRGVTVINTPGCVDSGYRGELKVALVNLSGEMQVIEKGERIAQLVIMPIDLPRLVEVEELDDTDRGSGGFGSTGGFGEK